MYAPQRRFFAVLAGLAVLLSALQGVTGIAELALYGAPLLLLAGLLLCGRFVGEERIVARLRTAVVGRVRRARTRWARMPARTLSSLLAHDPRVERGPPALVLAA